MKPGQPSRTAMGSAALRAAHQVLDHASVFPDPLALRILGPEAEDAVRRAEQDPPARRRLRLFVAVRARFAEDALHAAQGVRQFVVLGAGLDTTAYRTSLGNSLRMFEVDHPATQAWKRQRLLEVAIALPPTLSFAPVDFERETLADGLAAAGFDPLQRTFFTWLGVVPYLSEQAVFSTLEFVAGVPGGASVVFDYANPPASISAEGARAAHEGLAARVAAAGEELRTYFETDALRNRLTELGFRQIEDLGPAQIAERYFPNRTRVPDGKGAHILCAST